MMFKGDVGDVLWFDADGHARIDRIPLKIEGSLDGDWTWPNNWYAYWINRFPSGSSETITIFTPEWGERTGLAGGPQVQVADGVVTAIQTSSTIIPRNGFVVYFRGEAKAASHSPSDGRRSTASSARTASRWATSRTRARPSAAARGSSRTGASRSIRRPRASAIRRSSPRRRPAAPSASRATAR